METVLSAIYSCHDAEIVLLEIVLGSPIETGLISGNSSAELFADKNEKIKFYPRNIAANNSAELFPRVGHSKGTVPIGIPVSRNYS